MRLFRTFEEIEEDRYRREAMRIYSELACANMDVWEKAELQEEIVRSFDAPIYNFD